MDVLSGVLKSVHLEGAVYLNAEFTAPWCIRARYGVDRARARLPGAEHLLYFHFLTEGRCKVRLVDGAEVLDLGTGDLVLFSQDDRHVIGSDLHLAPVDTDGMADVIDATDFYEMRHGGGGEVTRFVCGYLACSRSVIRPLLQGLPRMLRIPIGDGQAAALVRDLLRVGVRESAAARPGADSLLARVAELLFVDALRRYIDEMPPGGKGWLAGMRDPHVGRALALLHEQPGRTWTVDELAREVALSRSALAERFAELVGEPPIQYLMRWRLALAARALRSSEESVSRIAERSGYESEAAFTRAFKREFGMPPTAWRKAAPQ